MALVSQAQDFGLESVGGRIGLSPNQHGRDFRQAEGFVDCNLPWKWDLGKEWYLQSRLDFSAGWLANSVDDAAVFTTGPSFLVGRQRLPFSFEVGFSPTLLSNHDFGTRNFGTPFQFTSHFGLNWDLGHFRVGYRFQHMSNADISQNNPGLSMQMVALSYRF